MAGFRNFTELVDAELAGQSTYFSWRKAPTQTTGAGIWFDLSMSPGNPVPNYYAATPVISKRLSLSDDGGLMHGGAVSPAKKYLKRLTAFSATAGANPLRLVICDYLLYYPFIDMSVTGYQPTENTLGLARYVDGAGVQVVAVVVASQIGGTQFNVTYTNQAGVAGRVTPNVICNSQVVNGTIISTQTADALSAGPFLPLQAGDTGVQLIEGVTFLSGDVGLITLVLVKPLANSVLRGVDAPVERNWPTDFAVMPQIEDNAYLNFLCMPAGSLSGAQIIGDIQTVWG